MSRLIIHRRLRLGEIARATGLTPGNASSHLAVLEQKGYVTRRRLETKVDAPSEICITNEGEHAFRRYVRAVRTALAQFDVNL